MNARSLLPIALALLAAPALSDEIHLTNGSTLEGHATRVRDEVVVTTHVGELRLPAAEVERIVPGKTRHDRYLERRSELEKGERADDPDAHVALGDWCREQDLDAQARRHWLRAVELDPEHRGAHGRLGHVRHEGRWMTEDEAQEARGFVRVDGEWVHRDVVARRRAAEDRERARREHAEKIRSCVLRMRSMKRRERLVAKVELQEYAEERGDLRLAAFASRVADHYNAQWRAVRAQLSRGSALTEVRATRATLKRPIPTFTTSLGANSTPVRIQLPELAVTSIRTTVLVPADIELDEDE